MHLIALIIFSLALVSHTSQAQEISPESVQINNINKSLIEVKAGPPVMMDGLYFPASSHQDEVAARRQFYDTYLMDRPLTLDSRHFRKFGTEVSRYGDRIGKLLTEDGLWVQKFMVRQGLALWSGSAAYPPDLVRQMQAAEREAERSKRGLWRNFGVFDAANAHLPVPTGQFIIAVGRVQEVYVTPKNTYLNFGEDWRTDFTAAIPSRSRSIFRRQGWKLAELENKIVRIRGWIRFYNGPFLEISFPQQLEIMEMTGD